MFWKHNCNSCQYVTSVRTEHRYGTKWDLYVHVHRPDFTEYVARFGDGVEDYIECSNSEYFMTIFNTVIGTNVIDNEGQLSTVLAINIDSDEPVYKLQHYPHSLWYVAEVQCTKCSKTHHLKFTTISNEEMNCGCGNKSYTELKRTLTGIKCTSNVPLKQFQKQYKQT